MHDNPLRRPLTLGHGLILLAVVAAIGGGAFAVAAIPGPDGRIKACIAKAGANKGAMRVIDHTKRCSQTERTLIWNRRGETGPPGATGPQGPQGQAGQQGPQGQQGQQGQQGAPGQAGQAGEAGQAGQDGQDGQDGSPGLSSLTVHIASSDSDATNAKSAIASCPAGKVVIAGGAVIQGDFQKIAIDQSERNNATSWKVSAHEHTATDANWMVQAKAHCAVVAP